MTRLVLSAAFIVVAFVFTVISAPAEAQNKRRCCEVNYGIWTDDLYTPEDCLALGPKGEFAPQGDPGDAACMKSAEPTDEPEDPAPISSDDNNRPVITGKGSLHDRYVTACLATTNNTRPICECVATRGKDTLTPLSFEMVIVGMEENEARSEELRSQLSVKQAMQAGMFNMKAFPACAKQMSGQ
jgi:hypothetical protein